MMQNSYLFTLLIFFLILSSCEDPKQQITNTEDYNKYLDIKENTSETAAKKEYAFWNEKLQKTPNQFPYLGKMASANSQLFGATGNIQYLIDAENNLVEANNKTGNNNASYLRTLARNYISQHRFKDALALLEKAETNGERLESTRKMLFDVHLELGNYVQAKSYLSQFKGMADFDYLIRLSKWSDHEGNLDAAIKYMEKAVTIAESSNISSLKQWSYTNLADFYGHANRLQDSYEHYLKALALGPNDAYAKKGIAWIVYSHERNPEEALRILNAVIKQHMSPDYYLLRAEIAEFMNDKLNKENNIQQYLLSVDNRDYGAMYNSHNAMIFMEELKSYEEAFTIAEHEIKERPTPQSYDLLAWAYYKIGEYKKALEVVENNIMDKTFEPETQYHMAEIYKANGREDMALKFKEELLESAYELGPVMEQKIRQL